MSKIDLNQPPPGHDYTVSVNPTETVADRRVRLFKDVILFLVAIAFVILITWLCVDTLLSPSASAEEKKWSMSILTAAAGGLIGYLVRR